MPDSFETISLKQLIRHASFPVSCSLGEDFLLAETSDTGAFGNIWLFELMNHSVRFDGSMMIFVRRGAFKVDLNLKTYNVTAGTVMAIVPGIIVRIHPQSEAEMNNLDIAFVAISPSFASGLRVEFSQALQERMLIADNPCIILTESQLETARTFNILGKRILNSQRENKTQAIRGLLSAQVSLLGEVWLKASEENARRNAEEISTRTSQVFQQFLGLVTEFHTSERGMKFYADKLCLTPKYLSKIIKQASGRSGPEWIDSFVILEAKNLLRYSDMSIKEVVYSLNFPNQSVFYKFFKANTGLTPSQYRRGDDGE